jgi:hypothetical protein
VVVRRENSELGKNSKGHEGLDWFRPPESKTPRPCGGIRHEWGSPRRALEGRPRLPCIGWRALGYKSVSIYPSWLQQRKLIRARLSCLVL